MPAKIGTEQDWIWREIEGKIAESKSMHLQSQFDDFDPKVEL